MPYATDSTLSQILADLDPSCFPPGASSTIKTSLLNKVRRMFYFAPKGELWRGTDGVLVLTVVTQPDTTQTVTMPRGWQVLLGVYDCDGAISLQNEWYGFLPGVRENFRKSSLIDLGDGFVGVANLPDTGAQLQFKTTATEVSALSIAIYGTDANGNPINETLSIPTVSGNTVTTANTYYSVTQIVKSITAADVLAYIVASPSNIFFARYQAGETSPNYRRYLFGFAEPNPTVTTRSKRKYIDLVSPNDPCDISNTIALELGLRAYRSYQAPDIVHAQSTLSEAFAYLNGELSRDESDSQLGSINIEYEQSGGSVRNLL